jgi:hypothetical protein
LTLLDISSIKPSYALYGIITNVVPESMTERTGSSIYGFNINLLPYIKPLPSTPQKPDGFNFSSAKGIFRSPSCPPTIYVSLYPPNTTYEVLSS